MTASADAKRGIIAMLSTRERRESAEHLRKIWRTNRKRARRRRPFALANVPRVDNWADYLVRKF